MLVKLKAPILLGLIFIILAVGLAVILSLILYSLLNENTSEQAIAPETQGGCAPRG